MDVPPLFVPSIRLCHRRQAMISARHLDARADEGVDPLFFIVLPVILLIELTNNLL